MQSEICSLPSLREDGWLRERSLTEPATKLHGQCVPETQLLTRSSGVPGV